MCKSCDIVAQSVIDNSHVRSPRGVGKLVTHASSCKYSYSTAGQPYQYIVKSRAETSGHVM